MRSLAFVLLFIRLLDTDAKAQPYPGATPVPRTTDRAVLRERARDREADERIRLGNTALGAGAWDRAAAEFERVLSLRPREPQASTAAYDLGIARARSGDLDAATRAFGDAIARDPGFLAARANLVSVLLMRGDLPAARKAADAFVAFAPDSARALYSRGILALRSGDAGAALTDFQKLLAADPSYAVAHYDLALAEERLGRYADSERELRAATLIAPKYTRARIALGAVLLKQGKRSEARAAFAEAARDATDPALENLALSLRDAISN